jgi:tetratricopeptide (TPR) repeat protein/transcriptional regulator with XRE-family HTH domain
VFGDTVRSHRRRLGLTQEELAERSGLSVRSIGKIEANQVGACRPATGRMLADAFGLSGVNREEFMAVAAGDSDVASTRLADRPDARAGTPLPPSVPRQLPAAVARLVGRDRELAMITRTLADPGGAPTVVAIHGPGGVGKSALAVAAAHAVAGSFPDGQLYVDLQGATATLAPLAVADVIGRFLRALGVAAAQVPTTEAEAVSLYRTLIAERRVLVVADNTGFADQIAAVMPVTAGSAMIVTSRRVLGMVDGLRIDLEPLQVADAQSLLAHIAGPARLEAEPVASATVAQACGRLPLALRIAGARLASHPHWTVSDLARRLTDERRTLHELNATDETLRASLQVSWRELRADDNPVDALAVRVFLALGSIRVPTVESGLAAALCASTARHAEMALDRLVEVRLVDTDRERFRMHDLVRLYAGELAAHDPDRQDTLGRALRWYASAADQVGRLVRGVVRTANRPQIDVLSQVADAVSAGAWLDGACANVVALVRQALGNGPQMSHLAGELVLALYPAVLMRGHSYEWEVLCRLIVDAADQVRDPEILAYVWTRLSVMYTIQLRMEQALECLDHAIPLHRISGDRSGEASALETAGMAHLRLGNVAQGLVLLESALDLRAELGERHAQGITLSNAAEAYHRLGRSDEALRCLERSLEIRREVGDVAGEGITLRNMGEVYAQLGRLAEALRMADAAIDCCRRSGDLETERRLLALRVRLRLESGDISAALVDCEHVLQLGGSPDDPTDLGELIAVLDNAGQHEYAGRVRRMVADGRLDMSTNRE